MQSYMLQSKYLFALTACLYVTVVSGSNKTCGCYMLGTLGGIEGESLCNNENLQCRCYQNVIGKNCSKCADGFYNILSGRGCISCRCNPLGSVNKSCHADTGQCQCKAGFTGFRCDRCEPYTYKFSSEKCQKCNCNPHGSKHLQCNIMGQCPCLPNVEGISCDHCKENMHNIKQGCVPCPPCYEFVQSAIKNYTKYLSTIEEAIEEIENNLPLLIQDYKYFLKGIRHLKAKIYILKLQYEDANKTISSEEAISKLTKEANDFHDEVVDLIQQLDHGFHSKEIRKALYTGRTNLKEANDLVATCEKALENATKISNSLNRHNKTITKIAQDAIETSEKIEDEAEELYQLSLTTTSSCNETCNTAEELLKKQQTQQKELENIKTEIENSDDGMKTMKSYLEGFHAETKASKDEALEFEEKANLLLIPDTDKMLNDLNIINENLTSINETVKNLTTDSVKIKEMQKATDDYAKKVKSKQKNIDDNLLLAYLYEERADLAINKTNDILKSAQESLNNIERFKEMKEAAEAALKNVPEIRDKVDAVLNNSDEITNIYYELSVIIKDMEKLQLNVSENLKMIENNKDEANINFKILEELEAEESKISKDLEASHGKVKGVKNNLKDLKGYENDIENDIKRMQEYILVLDTLPTSDKELDEVEEEIRKMEGMVEAVEYLTLEKEKLKKEIENVKDIIESIPIDDSTLCESAKSEPKETEG